MALGASLLTGLALRRKGEARGYRKDSFYVVFKEAYLVHIINYLAVPDVFPFPP